VDSPAASAGQVMQRMPGGPAQRPPQAARLGALGAKDAQVSQLMARAKSELDRRDYAAALNKFEQVILAHPRHPEAAEATFRAADAFFYLHEREMPLYYAQAMNKYQKAIDLYPQSDQVPWAMLQMGRTAMLAGEPFKAKGYFQLVSTDYPQSEYVPLALVNQGRALLAENKWGPALDMFRRVAKEHPSSRFRKDADWGQAQALFGLARYERASYLLQDMDRRWPKLRIEEPELLYYIGEAEFQLKRYPQARRYFLWALNIMPEIRDNDIILTRVADTYQFEGAYNAAKDLYRIVVNRFPGTDGALVARIRLAESPHKDEDHPWDIFQVKATAGALETYKEILKNYPDRPVAELAQLKLGVYYFKKKEFAQALAVLEELLNKNPRTPFRPEVEYTLDLATVEYLANLKKEDKPLELMDAYLRNRASLRRPNSNQMLEILAWAYSRTGLNQRAAKLYTVLISRGLNKPEYNVGLAQNLMVERDYQGVIKALDAELIKGLKGSEMVRARSLKGRALAKTDQCAQAVPLLEFVLGQRFTYPWIAQDYHSLGLCLTKLGRIDEALAALDEAEARFAPEDKLERYLVAMTAGAAARRGEDEARALTYYQRAVASAVNERDKAQAQYEMAASLSKLGQLKEMAQTYKELAEVGVNPWSDMAKRHIMDMRLAPRLAGVGKSPLDENGEQ